MKSASNPTTSRLRSREWVLVLGMVLIAVGGAAPSLAQDEYLGPSNKPDDPALRFLPQALAARRAPLGTSSTTGWPATDLELGGWNEPAIAVNPKDRMNIAYASAFELRVTTDGGTTWQAPVDVEASPGFLADGDCSLAFDSEGRLFWSYLASPMGSYFSSVGTDLFIAQCDPQTGALLAGYPVNVTEQVGVAGSSGIYNDKSWLAADAGADSPFRDRLYLAWSLFPASGPTVTMTTHSADHGLTWSPPLALGSTETFTWPAHVAVAPNGDVYVADHRQPGFVSNVPDGVSGLVMLFRSTDGGDTYPQQSTPFPPGKADMTLNVQSRTIGKILGARFWLQGSLQPWVLPDPRVPGRIHIVASDDPDNDVDSGDAADVFIVTSNDYGLNWTTPHLVSDGPDTTFQVMPTASIDPTTGWIVVTYYDNRSRQVNGSGDWLLDLYAAMSVDGGATFSPGLRINDAPFDPDAGARCRYNCGPFVSDVWAAGGGEAFAVTSSGQVLHRLGGTWTTLATFGLQLLSVWGSSSTDVFMCGVNGVVYHYDGVQMTQQLSGTSQDLHAMDGTSGSDVYAVGSGGTVVHYNGSNWSPLPPGPTDELNDVWVGPTGTVFAVGDNGRVLRYDGSWTDLSSGSGRTHLGVWGTTDNDVYACCENSPPEHWNGASWGTLDLDQGLVTSLWGSSATDLIALGFGRLAHFDGFAWSDETVSEHLLFRADGSAANDVYAVGEQGEIVRFDGSAWATEPNPSRPANPTLRIGEYNGVSSYGGRAFAVWCGNTTSGGGPLDQQSLFDAIDASSMVPVSVLDPLHTPAGLLLEAPSPNPAHRAVTVRYALPRAANVDVSLLDLLGRKVATLVHGSQTAGRHVLLWNDIAGRGLPPGVYALRLDDGRESVSRKLVVMPTGSAQ